MTRPFSAVEAHPYFHGYELGPLSFVAAYRSPLPLAIYVRLMKGIRSVLCENLCA